MNQDTKRALIDSAADDGLDERARARIAAAVGIGGGAVVTASVASAKVATWIKALLGIGVLGVVAAGLLLALPREHGAPPPARAVAATAVETSRVVPAASATADIPTFSVTDLPVAHSAAKPVGPAPAVADDDLAELERIRSELAEQHAAQALADLERYDAAHAGGAFADEAAVLRIEALAQLGGGEELQRRAAAFLAKSPSSPYAKRVRSLMNGDGGSR